MEHMRIANIALDVFCIILSMLLILYVFMNRRYRQKLNQNFLGVCVANVYMIIGDMADWVFEVVRSTFDRVVLTSLTVVFYAASAFVLYFFLWYIMDYLKLDEQNKKKYLTLTMPLCILQIVFAVISPVTGFTFQITAAGYQRGSLFWVSQMVPLVYYVISILLLFNYRKKLQTREEIFVLMYIFIPLGFQTVQTLFQGLSLVNVGITITLLLILINAQFEFEIVLKEQEKELAERRIDIMLSQIQPHFLYNSLSVIHHLCEENPMEAKRMLKEFSGFLRGNMSSLKAREPIPFEKELNHAMNYLYLEQQRFRNKLHVVCKFKTTDFDIPPLTLQPLIENAVQHGIVNKEEGGTVTISTEETEEGVRIAIEDDGIGMEKAKEYGSLGDHAHIGIENVRSRLKDMVNGSLEITSGDQGTTVILQIPWKEE